MDTTRTRDPGPIDTAMRRHLSTLVIGLTAFLTVVDLFATQAILPTLVRAYGVTPAAMGVAVNASTFGMAASGLVMALISRNIDRKKGILASLLCLCVPTALLAVAPNLVVFTALRVTQGLFMASAFTLTLAYLAENVSAQETTTAFAAYITGNVASNLIGRLVSAAVADHFGLAANFYVFAGLNLLGALLVALTLNQAMPMGASERSRGSPVAGIFSHLANPPLRSAFVIGFLILFAFIGTFTYVNFVLTRPPIALAQMSIGLVYFVFLPSIFTTPLAGRAAKRFGVRPTMWASLSLAAMGLPLLLCTQLPLVLAGMVMVGVGTFFAQATATGYVSQAATGDRGTASGLYLASYFMGGLLGAAVLGQLFDRLGWAACVAGIGASLLVAANFTAHMRLQNAAG
jgi:predicted MFS family arabinose efflux permease